MDVTRSGVATAYACGGSRRCDALWRDHRLRRVHVCLAGVKNMNGIGLVETDGRINFSIGHRCHAPCDDALRSDDAETVAAYLRKNFAALNELSEFPFDEFARAWVAQGWQCVRVP
jgi:hypothetical protein